MKKYISSKEQILQETLITLKLNNKIRKLGFAVGWSQKTKDHVDKMECIHDLYTGSQAV